MTTPLKIESEFHFDRRGQHHRAIRRARIALASHPPPTNTLGRCLSRASLGQASATSASGAAAAGYPLSRRRE
jgi:hypothetical protein